MPSIVLWRGDARERLKSIPDASIDAVVTDPPYGMNAQPDIAAVLTHWLAGDDYEQTGGGFMGKTWDSFVPGPVLWREVLRVLKPGGHAVVFASSRTVDLMGVACRLAGFEVRDTLQWLYGQGMPKSLDVARAIDEADGVERVKVGTRVTNVGIQGGNFSAGSKSGEVDVTVATSEDAKRWEGWGTALKPAVEPILLLRKPLTGTVAANVREFGTGGLNIDGCRIPTGDETISTPQSDPAKRAGVVGQDLGFTQNDADTMHAAQAASVERANALGRFPANVILSHDPECVETEEVRLVRGDSRAGQQELFGEREGGFFDVGSASGGSAPNAAVYGDEKRLVWRCVPWCPVHVMDVQSGISKAGGAGVKGSSGFASGYDGEFTVPYGDVGGASRFFYCPKPARAERDAGLDDLPESLLAGKGNGLARRCAVCNASVLQGCECPDRTFVNPDRKNSHPTVKPIELMRWLVRLVTPPGGTVLDPFVGSGTTVVAAGLEGFDAVGVDRDDEGNYLDIADARVRHWTRIVPLRG